MYSINDDFDDFRRNEQAREAMERFLAELKAKSGAGNDPFGRQPNEIRAAWVVGEDSFLLNVVIPGLQPEELKLAIDDRQISLIVSPTAAPARSSFGGKEYRIAIPDEVDASSAQARMEDGYLTVLFSKVMLEGELDWNQLAPKLQNRWEWRPE